MQEFCSKGRCVGDDALGAKGMPNSITNMMTMQNQYRSKAPNNGKKFKKKDTSSTTTFRKVFAPSSNFMAIAQDSAKMKKNKSSRARLKTVDSKHKLSCSKKSSKNISDGSNPSSGKKKRSSTKKNHKNKQSPKSKMGAELSKIYMNNRSKDYQNNVKFHPL